MRSEDRKRGQELKLQLKKYGLYVQPLPGIAITTAMDTFVFQIIESIRRVRFVSQIASRPISQLRANPGNALFDPVRAAMLMLQSDDLNEAAWLIFLFTHFGKNLKSGYQLVRDVYGRLGQGEPWTWGQISENPLPFRIWLDKHITNLKSTRATHRGFGNHRKYQSLSAWNPNGTGAAVESYIKWINNAGGHASLFNGVLNQVNGDRRAAFRILYQQMKVVESFGRMARFDFLTMVGKVNIANIEPDSVYFQGATGPILGAKLLFTGDKSADKPTAWLQASSENLANATGIGMQEMEDSLCNWQKSPTKPISFQG